MSRSPFRSLGAFVLCGCLCATVLSAQAPKPGSKETNVSTEKGKPSAAAASVTLLTQAGQLVGYARENESPIAMLSAVQIIRRVRVQDDATRVGQKKTEVAAQPASATSKKQSRNPFDTTALLNEAKGWAKGDVHTLALIDAELAKPATSSGSGTLGAVVRGVSQAIRHVDRVLPGDTDTYQITFRGGETARVGLVGDGDTDLDLYVYDENGNLVGRDADYSDECYVEWMPRWTGTFTVRIRNLGRVYNQYTLLTN